MTAADDLADSMVPVAADLACLVRDEDAVRIGRHLDRLSRQELYALAVVQAAMIPDDQPIGDLLGWMEPGTPQREEMLRKAHARAAKRQDRGLVLWGPLALLEREYQAAAFQRRRAAARGRQRAA